MGTAGTQVAAAEGGGGGGCTPGGGVAWRARPSSEVRCSSNTATGLFRHRVILVKAQPCQQCRALRVAEGPPQLVQGTTPAHTESAREQRAVSPRVANVRVLPVSALSRHV